MTVPSLLLVTAVNRQTLKWQEVSNKQLQLQHYQCEIYMNFCVHFILRLMNGSLNAPS